MNVMEVVAVLNVVHLVNVVVVLSVVPCARARDRQQLEAWMEKRAGLSVEEYTRPCHTTISVWTSTVNQPM